MHTNNYIFHAQIFLESVCLSAKFDFPLKKNKQKIFLAQFLAQFFWQLRFCKCFPLSELNSRQIEVNV